MRSVWQQRLLRLRSLADETYFVSTPLLGGGNPFALLNDALDSARAVAVAGPIARRSAIRACEEARQLCRHVDIAAQRNPAAWKGPIVPSVAPLGFSPRELALMNALEAAQAAKAVTP